MERVGVWRILGRGGGGCKVIAICLCGRGGKVRIDCKGLEEGWVVFFRLPGWKWEWIGLVIKKSSQ